MKILVDRKGLDSFKADYLILGKFEDKALSKEAKLLDRKLDGALAEALSSFRAEPKKFKTISTLGKIDSKRIMIIGLGKKKDFDLEGLRKTAAVSVKAARDDDAKDIATFLHNIPIPGFSSRDRAQAVTEGTVLGLYDFNKYRTVEREKIKEVSRVTLLCEKDTRAVETGVKDGMAVSEATNYVRDLVNTPANIVTPSYLAKEAQRLGKRYGFKVTVLGKQELKKKGLNALLAVSQGSDQDPKLIIMEKRGRGKGLALVGKGITFDSGGINLKPGKWIYDMKMDMSGAATVIGTFMAVGELKLPVSLVGIIPTCENMTGGSAQKPGDIVKSYNGKTIEVTNTDAEGRLILADGLAYAEKNYKPKATIDIATLTGSIMSALGYSAAGLFGNDESLIKKMKKAANHTYDRVWEMPLYDDFKEWMKSDNADVNNLGSMPQGFEAGAGTAAAFLSNFVEGKWAHLDIAGTAFMHENKEYLFKGGTGFGVRLLARLLQEWR